MQNIITPKNLFTLAILGFVAVFIVLPLTTHAYSYSGQKWSGTTVSVDVSDPSWPSAWISPLASAINAWNAASSPFAFNSAATGHQFKTSASGVGNPLAVTARTPLSGNPITDMDTTFNTSYPWSTSGGSSAYDVQNVATHELGHWLRLLDLYGSGDTEATMYYSVSTGEIKKRSLETDDLDGINYIYP